MMLKQMAGGVYPTMITPYKNGSIDYDAVKNLVDWYADKGCNGIFAVCQSSEMAFLSLKERVKLAETVVDQANGRMHIVASGHVGYSNAEQAEEITEISKTGIDAFILVSNRFDLQNDGDDTWLANAKEVLDTARFDIPLGIYECPAPYKRLLTPRILDWCKQDGRFRFIKDTCCDPVLLAERIEQLKDSDIMLFNANVQTLLYTLKKGAAGFSGIMANFHPDLLVWLCEHWQDEPEKAEELGDLLSMMGFTESLAYPCTAKYYLSEKEGVKMEWDARSRDAKQLNAYNKMMVDQIYAVNQRMRSRLGL